MIRAVLFLLAVAAVPLSACSQPCDSSHLCDVDQNGNVCDGTHYSACDDTTRGQRIACPDGVRTVVCPTNGWTFENSPH